MLFWRISKHADLSGKGGLIAPARWHLAGQAVVYLADSSAGALLESCAHTSRENAPPTFTLLRIAGPGSSIEEVGLERLPSNWVTQQKLTQAIGNQWLEHGNSALLRVPSALVPESWNYLLNPAHAEAGAFTIEQLFEYPFDLRLKR